METRPLYYEAPYDVEFDAEVIDVEGQQITLDATLFYPGGGGQLQDSGTLNGRIVNDVTRDGERIVHLVPDHSLSIGDSAHGKIDWERRYRMMRGHTAEHLLMKSLIRVAPETRVEKVALRKDTCSVFVSCRKLDWEAVRKALLIANEQIGAGKDVRMYGGTKAELEGTDIRVKWNKLKGDTVRAVEIAGFDLSACTGIHVKNLGEIGFLQVSGLVRGGKDTYKLDFMVGDEGKRHSLEMSTRCQETCALLNSAPENLLKTVSNMKEGLERLEEREKRSERDSLGKIEPEIVGKDRLYSGTFEGFDQRSITSNAAKIVKSGGVALFANRVGERVNIVLGCDDGVKIDCRALLQEALGLVDGKGGGNSNFASGSGTKVSMADEAVELLRERIKSALGD